MSVSSTHSSDRAHSDCVSLTTASVLVIVPLECRPCIRAARAVLRYLHSLNIFTFVERTVHRLVFSLGPHVFDTGSISSVDYVVAIGDDTTVIYASSLFPEHPPPILGLHITDFPTFIAQWHVLNYKKVIQNLLNNTFSTCPRHRISATLNIVNDGTTIRSSPFTVLSDIVIDRGQSPSLCNLETFCDSQFVTTIQADGVVFATPTGSAYYSSAAGGPTVHPLVPAFVLTPICPHSLSFRPLVMPDSTVWKIRVSENSRDTVSISFDGKFRQPLKGGDFVTISLSSFPLNTVVKDGVTEGWLGSLNKSCNPTPKDCDSLGRLFWEEEGELKEEEVCNRSVSNVE
ncbi:hypothetical protein P9112_008923 [Eukaryota sp. TZLM1-RC]